MSNIKCIWGRDDFDETVREAQAVVEAGRRRRHLQAMNEHLPPAVLFTRSRERRARRMDALAVGLLMAFMAALGVVLFAATAKADALSSAWADRYGGLACVVLSEYPSVGGLMGILDSAQEDGLTQRQAGEAVGESIATNCPEYGYLVRQFIARYGKSTVA